MDSSSSVAIGRWAVFPPVQWARQWLATAALVLLGLLWSGLAQAQSCDFVAIGPTAQAGPTGSTVSFTIEAQTACAATVNVQLAVAPGDGTGGATIVPPANPTLALDTPYTFNVTLGPTPGGAGVVIATCLSGGCAGDILQFDIRTNNQFVYTNATPATVVTNTLGNFTVATSLQFNGAPGGLSTSFNNLTLPQAYGTVTPNAGGVASLTQPSPAAGNYLVRGSVVCPVTFVLEGCAAVPPVDFNVQVEPVGISTVTPATVTMFAGSAETLTIYFGSASIPGPDGTPINWVLTAQPPGGDGLVNGPNLAGGQSSALFSATVPGAYTVQANLVCAVCTTTTATFVINVVPVPIPFVLAGASANPAAAVVGAPVAFAVELTQGGAPVPGEAIQWFATPPFAPASATDTTDTAGLARASFTASAAGTFVGAVSARFDPDGVPGNGDEITYAFDAVVATVPGLAVVSGNGQQAVAGTAFAQPLVVRADDSGSPAVAVGIDWVVSGDAVLTAGGPTDGAGQASATLLAGQTAGPVLVTATRQDAPGTSTSFSLVVVDRGELQLVSGDGQGLVPGQASEPMVVRLLDFAGVPVAGASIAWATTGGTLEAASSTTNAAGEASMRLTLDAAGEFEVTASTPLANAPVVFRQRGSLARLPGLNQRQSEIASAVDNLCPALAALGNRSAAQQDLYDRCIDLSRAAAVDPAATVLALDQLMADVALVQGNAAFAAAHSQFQNLRARIAALRAGTQGTDFGGLALTTPQGLFSIGLLAQSFGDEDPSMPAEIGADFSRWGFFASGVLGRGEVEPGQVDPAYDNDIEGLTAGVDYRVSDRWIVGGSLGMTRQDATLPDGRGEVETSGWSVSAYTTWYQEDSWYLDGVLTWGRNDYDLLRSIRYTLTLPGGTTSTIDQQARSSSDGDLLSLAFTFGRDFNRGAWGLGPYGRLLFTRLDFDSIEETLLPGTGSGLGLRIEQRELESLASVLGGKLTYTHSTDWGVLMPHLQLEWEHEFRDDPQALEARFLHDPTGTPMVLRGDPLDTDYYRIGLGLSMVLTKGRSGFFYYERLLGKDRTSQYNLALGFRMEF